MCQASRTDISDPDLCFLHSTCTPSPHLACQQVTDATRPSFLPLFSSLSPGPCPLLVFLPSKVLYWLQLGRFDFSHVLESVFILIYHILFHGLNYHLYMNNLKLSPLTWKYFQWLTSVWNHLPDHSSWLLNGKFALTTPNTQTSLLSTSPGHHHLPYLNKWQLC